MDVRIRNKRTGVTTWARLDQGALDARTILNAAKVVGYKAGDGLDFIPRESSRVLDLDRLVTSHAHLDLRVAAVQWDAGATN